MQKVQQSTVFTPFSSCATTSHYCCESAWLQELKICFERGADILVQNMALDYSETID